MTWSGIALKIFCKHSLSLAESFGILLRKIEELTLYMLELKKKNEDLRKMINEKLQF